VTATKQPSSPPPHATSPTIRKAPRRRRWPLLDLYSTAVGKKWVMAITGLVLIGYVVAHMVGNLKMYLGPESLDEYGQWLRAGLLVPIVPEGFALWMMRPVLLVAFALHIHAAYSLTILNRKARPVTYQSPRDYIAVSWAARTMRWSGIIVLLFVLFHIADLTLGWTNPDFEHGEVYANVVASFERLPVAIFYVLANLALGLHLYHGIWSLFQTMGSMNPRFNPRANPIRRGIALALTVAVVAGNVSFPIAVQAGIVDIPAAG
jgi:succinate dehydrogenase / fumarate reductase, cytochrome b subunit